MGEFLAKLLSVSNPLWYFWPLAFVIGAVYKTTQYDKPRDIIKGTLHFVGSTALLVLVLAVVLLALTEWFGGA